MNSETATTETTTTETSPAPETAPALAETIPAHELLTLIEAAVERGVRKALAATKPDPLELAWMKGYAKNFKGEPRGRFNDAELDDARRFAKLAGDDAITLINAALDNWEDCLTVVKRDSHLLNRPPMTIHLLADHFKIVKAWAKMRGLITGVPQIVEHRQIGRALPAEEPENHTYPGRRRA